MNLSSTKSILDAYVNKILGIRNYKSEKKEFFVDDFINIEILVDFLNEVCTGESDITPAGKSFLEKYYGFEALAQTLVQRKFTVSFEPFLFNEMHAWLQELKSMETLTFIETAKGNIKGGAPLRSDLLPPKI